MENINAKNPVLEEQEKIVESILFMMGESVSVDTLALAIYSDEKTAREAAERLVKKYEDEYSDRGMKIIRLNGKYQMVANNIYFKNLIQVAAHPKKPVITEAVLETLSIIAYKQPITKPEIEDIRGVKSDFAVNRLIEYGLIEEQGRLDAPGRPIIFGTTEEFLLRFGLESTKDLPKLDPARMEEIVKEVEKEVSQAVNEPYVVEKNEVNKENVDDNNIDLKDNNDDSSKTESVTENFNQPVVEETSATDDEKETEVEENKESDDFEDYVNKEILIEIDEEEKKKNEELLKLKEENDNHINKTSNITIEIDDKDNQINNSPFIISDSNYSSYSNETNDNFKSNDTNVEVTNISNEATNKNVDESFINNEDKGNDEECKKEKTSFIKSVLNAIKRFFEKIINFFKRK